MCVVGKEKERKREVVTAGRIKWVRSIRFYFCGGQRLYYGGTERYEGFYRFSGLSGSKVKKLSAQFFVVNPIVKAKAMVILHSRHS